MDVVAGSHDQPAVRDVLNLRVGASCVFNVRSAIRSPDVGARKISLSGRRYRKKVAVQVLKKLADIDQEDFEELSVEEMIFE